MKQQNMKYIYIAVIVIIAGSFVLAGIYLFADNFKIELPFDLFNQDQQNNDDNDLISDVNNDVIPDVKPDNFKNPTSLTINVAPNPVYLGNAVYGTCTSNGYNVGLDIEAKYLGTSEIVHVAGWLGTDGQFNTMQQMNTCGIWEFQATSDNGIKSNKVSLTVQGMSTGSSLEHYSKTFADEITFSVYTHHTRQSVTFVADNGVTNTFLGSSTVNSGGYAEITVNLDSLLANGDYKIDAVIGSDRADYYGKCAWISVGR